MSAAPVDAAAVGFGDRYAVDAEARYARCRLAPPCSADEAAAGGHDCSAWKSLPHTSQVIGPASRTDGATRIRRPQLHTHAGGPGLRVSPPAISADRYSRSVAGRRAGSGRHPRRLPAQLPDRNGHPSRRVGTVRDAPPPRHGCPIRTREDALVAARLRGGGRHRGDRHPLTGPSEVRAARPAVPEAGPRQASDRVEAQPAAAPLSEPSRVVGAGSYGCTRTPHQERSRGPAKRTAVGISALARPAQTCRTGPNRRCKVYAGCPRAFGMYKSRQTTPQHSSSFGPFGGAIASGCASRDRPRARRGRGASRRQIRGRHALADNGVRCRRRR